MAEHCRGRSSTFKPCNRYLLPLVLPLVLWSQQILAQVERVSVGSEGTQGNGNSLEPALSTDGRFVAFLSQATNLVAGDTNGPAGFQVFVHDRQTGLTERVSIASDGTPADAGSLGPAISGDGRFVAFDSNASNLVAGDTTAAHKVFIHDRQTGMTERVTVALDGSEGNGTAISFPTLSAAGRFVAFDSNASNLVADDSNGVGDIFVHDRQTGLTERVSVASDGSQANGESAFAIISANGRFVAFNSNASNLVTDDTNGVGDVFVHDRQTGLTERVNVAFDGSQGDRESPSSSPPRLSADGRLVAFQSEASNSVHGSATFEWRL